MYCIIDLVDRHAWTYEQVEGLSWDGRAVAHIDLDAFFASVAQLDNPELRGKPVIVGGRSGRGVVATCSYEARKFGVRSAMPSAQADRLCPDAIWVSSDFVRYRQFSSDIFALLYDLTPHVRQVSIDEAFFEITPDLLDARHPTTVIRELQYTITESSGITGSVGLSTSMTVAKIGSDVHKPRGLTVIPPGQEANFLSPMSVRKMSGIGPKAAEKLALVGVKTLGELAQLDKGNAQLIFGKTTQTMLQRAAGIDTRPVITDDPTKSVSNEYTFDIDITTSEEVHDALKDISTQLARRLRKKQLRGRCVTLKLRFKGFQTKTVSRTFPAGIDNEKVLSSVSFSMAQSIWSEGMPIRLLGVGVTQFDDAAGQLSLFSDADTSPTVPDVTKDAISTVSEEDQQLSAQLDGIKDKFGEKSVLSGRQLKQASENKPWKARSITGGPKPKD